MELDKGGVVGAVSLDLKKAFDTVNHEALWSKLFFFKSEDAIKWMRSYLNDRTQGTVHVLSPHIRGVV